MGWRLDWGKIFFLYGGILIKSKLSDFLEKERIDVGRQMANVSFPLNWIAAVIMR